MRWSPIPLALLSLAACSFETKGSSQGSASGSGGETGASTEADATSDATTSATTSQGATTSDGSATVASESTTTTDDTTTQSDDSGVIDDSTSEDTEARCEGTQCLSDDHLLVRYFLDEPALGLGPTTALDATPSPLNLAINTGDAGPAHVEDDSSWGLEWTLPGGSGVATAGIAGTKIAQLDAQTTATIEVVARVEAAVTEPSRFIHVGSGSEGGRFTLSTSSLNRVVFVWQGETSCAWNDLPDLGPDDRVVLHAVLDTSAAPEERLTLYVDGDPAPPPACTVPVFEGQAIALSGTESFNLGNRANGNRSFQGMLYYAAVYTAPLSPEQVDEHATILLDSDDSP